MNALTASILLGLGLAAGLALLFDFFLRGRRVSLADRMAPHFGQSPRGGPLAWPGSTWANAPKAGDVALERALRAAGLPPDPVRYRQGDLLAASVAAAAAVALALLVSLRSGGTPWAGVFLLACAVLAALWWRRERLRRAARRRTERMTEQFPALAELLALSVAAGDSVGPALGRCATALKGELATELAASVAELRRGAPLPTVLKELAERLQIEALGRCVDAIAVASERGTPLASVLRDQAADAREAGRRALIESAGRKEVGMLVPVVFGVLPLSIVFAVYPGLELLRLSL